jgi:exonuclease SbcD
MISLFHTADWHFGAVLYGQRRYREHAAFAQWFVDCVAREKPDVVLISGDIFDTTTPSHQAQTLYYDTIAALRRVGCPHIVVTGGNHDAPAFLNAIQPLVKDQGIYIVGAATEDPADTVLLLRDSAGIPQLIICAVPYLRDKDVRLSEANQSPDDKHDALIGGVRQYYADVVSAACQLRDSLSVPVPIVGMGHLFVAGGVAGDGVRDLYVGTLSHVGADIFPACLDYVALGHLHVPQVVSGVTDIRYSGSPIPMGFGEAKQQKRVLKVMFQDPGIPPEVVPLYVPRFQSLATVSGDWEALESALLALVETATHTQPMWLDIVYTGDALMPDLRDRIAGCLSGHPFQVLRIKHQRVVSASESLPDIDLAELTHEEVFERCLAVNQIPEAQAVVLRDVYRETWLSCVAGGDDL